MRNPIDAAAPALDTQILQAIREAVAEAVTVRPQPGPMPLLTKADVARALRVSIRTVDTLVAEGEIVPVRIRSARRFTPEAVDRYIRHQASRR